MIESASNARIKELVKLQKNARQRRQSKCFVAEGRKLVDEAASHGALQQVFIDENLYQKQWNQAPVEQVAEAFSPATVEIVSPPVFQKACGTVTPQGILGIVRMPEYSLEHILSDERGLFLLLDDVRDPGNLGTILRTGEGAGIAGVIMSSECVDLFNPKVVRSTMGSIFRVPFVYVEDMAQTVKAMQEQGIAVWGCCMGGNKCYDRIDYRQRTAIVIGNEANGISAPVQAQLTGKMRIPMAGQLESLNAAVSAAVVMYEAARQRDFQ